MTTNPSILSEAADIVGGSRQADYGTPLANHSRTAALWSAYLGIPVTARQVCMMNVLQKVSRDVHAPKRDNLVDIAGYAENAHLCAAAEEAYRKAMTEPSPLLADLPMTPCPCGVYQYNPKHKMPEPSVKADDGC